MNAREQKRHQEKLRLIKKGKQLAQDKRELLNKQKKENRIKLANKWKIYNKKKIDYRVEKYHEIKNYLANLDPYVDFSSKEILLALLHSKQELKFIKNECPYYDGTTPTDGKAISLADHQTIRANLKSHIKLLKMEQEIRSDTKKQQELERREQNILNLDLEKQRLAQEYELRKMEMQLQIEETKLLREREERQANRDSINSLRDSLRND